MAAACSLGPAPPLGSIHLIPHALRKTCRLGRRLGLEHEDRGILAGDRVELLLVVVVRPKESG